MVKGHMYGLTNRIGSEFSYYVSAEEFQKYLSDAYLMSFLFDTADGRQAEMEEFLKDYTEHAEPAMSYESRTTYAGSFDRILGMIAVVGTGLSVMIGLIGMTKRQMAGMLTAEGMFYVLLTILFSAIIGTLFSLTAIRGVGDGIWFMHYRFTLLPLLAVCPVLLLFGALVPKAVYGLRKKENIVEELRE